MDNIVLLTPSIPSPRKKIGEKSFLSNIKKTSIPRYKNVKGKMMDQFYTVSERANPLCSCMQCTSRSHPLVLQLYTTWDVNSDW
jgi:hypothetical protein